MYVYMSDISDRNIFSDTLWQTNITMEKSHLFMGKSIINFHFLQDMA